MITHYLKIALRNLWKYKTQSIISIVGLSLGFLSFMLCNYYVQYHLFYNTQIPNSDRIYKLNTSLKESDLSKEFPEIEKILPLPTPYGITGLQVDCTINIEDKDISHQVFISNMLDPSFIDFFSLSIIYGTKEIIAHPNGSIVLFESEAKKLTENTASLIGKEVKMDNKSYFITGILKNPPVNSTFGGIKSIYFLTGQKSLVITYPDQNNKYAYCIQLNKTASKSNFLNKLEHYFNKNKNENETENKYELEPFTGLSNFSEYSINIGKFLFTFGLLILLASLFNFILLQFSMYYNHFREYGIRIVNGMNGWQLTLQLFVDIMIRFLLSGVIVFIIIELNFHNFERIYRELTYINLDLHLLMQHLMKYILYGTALSFVLSYILSHNLLKRSIRSVSGYLLQRNNNNRGRNMLLFLQMLVIIIFISAAGIVKLQVNSMKSNIFSNFTRNERENIIYFPGNIIQLFVNYDILLQKISNSTDVLDVTGSEDGVIRTYDLSNDRKIAGFEDKIVENMVVAFNFCNFFNGHIIQGNGFENQDDYDAAIVNENFLKLSLVNQL